MAIHTPEPPSIFKRILELDGFSVVHEDELNWSLFKDDFGLVQPIILPKKFKWIPFDTMSNVLHRAKMPAGTYVKLLHIAETESSSH